MLVNNIKKRLLISKIGGSAFDLGRKVIEPLCQKFSLLANEMSIVLSVGGGPPIELLKELRDEYEIPQYMFDKLTPNLFKIQTMILSRFLLSSTECKGGINEVLKILKKGNIPVLTPSDIWDIDGSLSDSDLLILHVADKLRASEVIFLKDTPGIYKKCPIRPINIMKNPPIFEITTRKFRDNISRIGLDGRDEHLIENSALTLLENSKHLKQVIFLNCREPHLLDNYLNGKIIGSILKRE